MVLPSKHGHSNGNDSSYPFDLWEILYVHVNKYSQYPTSWTGLIQTSKLLLQFALSVGQKIT